LRRSNIISWTRITRGTAGLKYTAKKGLDIVVMEPIRGSLLARDLAGVFRNLAKGEGPTSTR